MISFHQLTPKHQQRWRELQSANPALDSPFFCLEFARAVATVRDDVEVAILEENGEPAAFFPFQRWRGHHGKPLGGRLSDYQAVIAKPGFQLEPRRLLSACDLRVWDFDHLIGDSGLQQYRRATDLSPYLDLSAGFDDYRAALRPSGVAELKQTERKARKLAREVGPLRLEFHSTDEAAFNQMLRWKSDQYQRTNVTDVFSFGWTTDLVRQIWRTDEQEFSGVLSVLWAGDQIVALHMGMRYRHNLHWWFPTYDPQLSRYSPGRILLLELARASSTAGITKIDLGRGVVPYKARAMSGAIEVAEGSVDLRPLARHLRSGARVTREWLRQSPLRAPARLPGRMWHRLREAMEFR